MQAKPPARVIGHGTLIFGLAYWIFFHTLGIGEMPRDKFDRVMAEAQAEQLARMEAAGIDNAFYVAMSENAASVAEGRDVFVTHCVACHLDDGRGSVGPNLTDQYWVHGCEPMDMQRGSPLFASVVNSLAHVGFNQILRGYRIPSCTSAGLSTSVSGNCSGPPSTLCQLSPKSAVST